MRHLRSASKPTISISSPSEAAASSDSDLESMAPPQRSMEKFLSEATKLFSGPLSMSQMLEMSSQLRSEFLGYLNQRRDMGSNKSNERKRQKRKSLDRHNKHSIAMLPSFNHTLPSGHETGSFLSLDVGGSGVRIALVKLHGKQNGSQEGRMEIVKAEALDIDETIRRLKGREFFDWLADGIGNMIAKDKVRKDLDNEAGNVAMGIAWSFPIEQTSIRSGKLLEMGKGFCASDGLLGEDLAELITSACQKRKLPVQVAAIINDGSATLLSRAYAVNTTRFGLILGTGTNVSVMLPTSCIPPHKLVGRPDDWQKRAKEVLVNTEYSLFGQDVLPFTKWDEDLNRAHRLPDFQPFEHFVGGRYIGEIVRRVVEEAVETAGLFGGQLPGRFEDDYSLQTKTLGVVERDDTGAFSKAIPHFQALHPLPSGTPTAEDMAHLRAVARLVTRRAASLLAVAIHAFWLLRIETLSSANAVNDVLGQSVAFACNGGIVLKYPNFLKNCQHDVDELCRATREAAQEDGGKYGKVDLDVADEAAVYGAAVAAVVAQKHES